MNREQGNREMLPVQTMKNVLKYFGCAAARERTSKADVG